MKCKQCLMVNGEVQQTGWISEDLAVAGKTLKDEDGKFWKVKTVYSTTMDEKEANLRSRDYTKTRKATDI